MEQPDPSGSHEKSFHFTGKQRLIAGAHIQLFCGGLYTLAEPTFILSFIISFIRGQLSHRRKRGSCINSHDLHQQRFDMNRNSSFIVECCASAFNLTINPLKSQLII